jgi:hypothetical protein
MPFLQAVPEAMTAAASDLAGIGSTISSANSVAAVPTTGVPAAAADEVSTQIAALLSEHALGYQQLSTQVATFHEQFVQALRAGASSYAATDASAAQTLASAVNAPAQAALGSPLIGSTPTAAGPGAAAGGALSNAVGRAVGNSGTAGLLRASNLLGGNGAAAGKAAASALPLGPTGGSKALTAASPLLRAGSLTNALAAPAANGDGSIGDAIENADLTMEPWMAHGFNLLSSAAGGPGAGIVAPQTNFLGYLFEPVMGSGLFNTTHLLDGTVSVTQGLSNTWASTTASINQFIPTEINWVLSFLPPLPPIA